MNKRNLGNGFGISEIGLGCGNLSYGYGDPIRLLQEAVEHGITFFDTVSFHKNNMAEDVVGDALRFYKSKTCVATRCDIGTKKMQLRERIQAMRKSVETSLNRLHRETIDLCYVAHMDIYVCVEAFAETMQQLMREGKVRSWGLLNADLSIVQKANTIFPITAVQNQYSLARRNAENKLIAGLEKLHIGLVAACPLGGQEMMNRYNYECRQIKQSNSEKQTAQRMTRENARIIEVVRNMAEMIGATPAQVMLAWILQQRPWIVPIPGTRLRKRVYENIHAQAVDLTEYEWNMFNEELARHKI